MKARLDIAFESYRRAGTAHRRYQDGNGNLHSYKQNASNERRASSRPKPSYAESDDIMDMIMNHWSMHGCSKREQVEPGRLYEASQLYLRSWTLDKSPVDFQYLFFTASSGYMTNDRISIVLGLRANRYDYYDVLPSRYFPAPEKSLKRSYMINGRKSVSTLCRCRTKAYVGDGEGPSQIHPFDMCPSVRIKFSMEQKEAREVSAPNAPVF
ncbi:hypothetical protein F5146DRAFT_1003320 [Armillaria mellea]|nr:hypothetical protein F5146DRAFT_1003320 [Armillaria mellea]